MVRIERNRHIMLLIILLTLQTFTIYDSNTTKNSSNQSDIEMAYNSRFGSPNGSSNDLYISSSSNQLIASIDFSDLPWKSSNGDNYSKGDLHWSGSGTPGNGSQGSESIYGKEFLTFYNLYDNGNFTIISVVFNERNDVAVYRSVFYYNSSSFSGVETQRQNKVPVFANTIIDDKLTIKIPSNYYDNLSYFSLFRGELTQSRCTPLEECLLYNQLSFFDPLIRESFQDNIKITISDLKPGLQLFILGMKYNNNTFLMVPIIDYIYVKTTTIYIYEVSTYTTTVTTPTSMVAIVIGLIFITLIRLIKRY